jgi:hypothetical protein
MPLQNSYYLACPWCLEHFQVIVDLTGGSQEYTEDCEVCCHPVLMTIKIEDGQLVSIDGCRENE